MLCPFKSLPNATTFLLYPLSTLLILLFLSSRLEHVAQNGHDSFRAAGAGARRAGATSRTSGDAAYVGSSEELAHGTMDSQADLALAPSLRMRCVQLCMPTKQIFTFWSKSAIVSISRASCLVPNV